MAGYSISQTAARTGFTPSALRYYERVGLVTPTRTASGYRSYEDEQIDTLRFVGRAKTFGLSLDEISDVVRLLDGDRCAPVQIRMRELIATKINDSQTKLAELVAFTAELQRLAGRLDGHTPDGPCDESCGCTTDGADESNRSEGVTLVATTSATTDDPPLACTLSPEEVPERVAGWQTVIAAAEHREPTSAGVRLRFPADIDVGRVASLAAAEQQCCQFFAFHLTIATRRITLEITGPDDARPVIDALVGTTA
jgi:DNA-binding transcriptional MerR regulator